MGRAIFDQNNVPSLTAVSGADGVTPVEIWADPTSHSLLALQSAGALVPVSYDYISYTNTNTTTDTYVYKTGGSGGTTVATLTLVFTDTTKSQISSVART